MDRSLRLLALPFLLTACDGSITPLDGPMRLVADGPAHGYAEARLTSPSGMTGSTPIITLRRGGVDPSVATQLPPVESALDWWIDRWSFALDRRGPYPTLEPIAVPLGDLLLEGGLLPPEGMMLRDLTLSMKERTRARVGATDERLIATAAADFVLEWKLELADGTLYRLGPLPLGATDVRAVALRSPDGETRVTFHASCPGACAEVPGFLVFHDFAVDLSGSAR
jgi:hypothetical protein